MAEVTDRTKDAIKVAILDGKMSRTDIAAKFSVSRGTVYAVAKSIGDIGGVRELNEAVKMTRLSAQAGAAKGQLRAALGKIAELEDEITLIRRYKEVAEVCVPMKFEVRPNATRHDAVALSLWSDWHIDEDVDYDAMNGLNEYNPEIAEARVRTLVKCTSNIIDIYRKNSDVTTMVIALIGDMLTAWIHDDSVSSNHLTPPEGVVTVFNMLVGAIDTLMGQFPDMNFVVVEAPGNHGRITKRLPSKQTPQKNLEWIIFQLLAQRYAEHPKYSDRIRFRPPAGDQNWLDILGRHIRFTHGTQIRYQGGIGGPTVSLLKALKAWDTGDRADFTVLGHLHTPLTDMRRYAMNGSLIGYNSFARDFVKAEYSQASQVMLLMHNVYGPTGFYNIVVQKPRGAE